MSNTSIVIVRKYTLIFFVKPDALRVSEGHFGGRPRLRTDSHKFSTAGHGYELTIAIEAHQPIIKTAADVHAAISRWSGICRFPELRITSNGRGTIRDRITVADSGRNQPRR